MLNLLYKFGLKLEQSDDDEKILISSKKLKRKKDTSYKVASILIDLDTNRIEINTCKIKDFDKESSIKDLYVTKTKDARFIEISASFVAEKFYCFRNIIQSTDGKSTGLISKLIEFLPNYQEKLIYKIAQLIAKNFISFTYHIIEPNKDTTLNYEEFTSNQNNLITLGAKEKILIYYIEIRCTELNIPSPMLLAKVDGYLDLIKAIFLPPEGKKKLCYVTGELRENVTYVKNILDANLTKIYQTTKYHHAVDFLKKNFEQNFSISEEASNIIGSAEKYLKENLEFNIAGIKNTLIPELPINYNGNIHMTVDEFKDVNDLIFNQNTFEKDIYGFLDNTTLKEQDFTFHYIAHFTDNKAEKITNRIYDVKCKHLINLIKLLKDNASFFPDINPANFNLESVYRIIPERAKAKKNNSMHLIQLILENKKVNAEVLFNYFIELILYYKYNRVKAYTNIRPKAQKGKEDIFIKRAIIKYLIIFRTLINLNILTNHNFKEVSMPQDEISKSDVTEEDFFIRQRYNEQQIAMFYLGRVINIIAYAQYKSNHKNRPILNKLNYKGITRDEIVKLRNELFEKANQYRITDKTSYAERKFIHYFDYNDWRLSPKEAIFFITNGYYFNLNKKNNYELIEYETEEEDGTTY